MNVPKDPKSFNRHVKDAGSSFVPLSTLQKPGSGSKWSYADILTFRVVLQRQEEGFPPILDSLYFDADAKLKSEAVQSVAALVKAQAWRSSPRDSLRTTGKEFGSFLSYVGEVLEKPWSSEAVRTSDRQRSGDVLAQNDPLSDEEEALSTKRIKSEF